MKKKLIVLSALASGAVMASPAHAQLSPGTTTIVAPVSPSTTAQTTAVSSGIQSQTNTTAYVTLPGISSVIQQTLMGPSLPGPRSTSGLGPLHSGVSAGDDPMSWQVWAQTGGGQATNTLATGGYSIGSYGAQLGVQKQITPKLLLGLSGAWQGSSGTMSGGFASTNSTFGVTAYAGYQLDEHWNVSAMAGFSAGTNAMTNSGFNYRANYASSQWNFQGGLNGYYKVGAVVLAPMRLDPLLADQQLRLHRQQPHRRARPDHGADARLGRRLHQPAARQVAALHPRHHRAGFLRTDRQRRQRLHRRHRRRGRDRPAERRALGLDRRRLQLDRPLRAVVVVGQRAAECEVLRSRLEMK